MLIITFYQQKCLLNNFFIVRPCARSVKNRRQFHQKIAEMGVAHIKAYQWYNAMSFLLLLSQYTSLINKNGVWITDFCLLVIFAV